MATITGTIQNNGVAVETVIRAWFQSGPIVATSGVVQSEGYVLIPTGSNGAFSKVLVQGRWLLTWEAGGIVNSKAIDVPAGSGSYTMDAVAVAGGGGGGGGGGSTFTVYWGVSANTTLNESQITALDSNGVYSSIERDYAFAAGGYKFFAWPDSAGSPRATDGFYKAPFAVSMAGSAEGFASAQNGWSYSTVTISGTAYRLYRTRNTLGGAVTITVQ